MKYVLATANPGKIKELGKILSELGIEFLTRKDLGIDIEIDETGSTFLENATLKADAITDASGMPAIADDSGLIVDALGGEPGLYSSSYGGEELADSERCMYLLGKMENIQQRRAKFVCTIVCSFPDGKHIAATGECHGEIMTAPGGSDGFGFDPVFLPDGKDRTMAELTIDEKNEISHRGIALREFSAQLRVHESGTQPER